jgi:hypothetical protein
MAQVSGRVDPATTAAFNDGVHVPNFFGIVADGAIGVVAIWGFDRTGVEICDRDGRKR